MPSIFSEIIHQIVTKAELFFKWYSDAGREFLNFLHVIFDNGFYVFLGIAFLISVLYYILLFHNLFGKKRTKNYRFNEDEAPFVTIQIPTFNELAALNCAERCLNFDYPRERYEILIGDDSNDPEISQKIQEFAGKHSQMKVFKRERNMGFKPGNLNNLLKYSRGEYLVLFDSDFLPERDFLKRIIAPLQNDPKLSVVQARWKIINPNHNLITVLGATMSKVFHYLFMPFVQNFGGVSFLCGSAEAVRKKDLVDMGGWQSGSLTEDIEYSMRLLTNNKKLMYLEDLECECEVPYTPKDLYRQQMRWAYGVIAAAKLHFRNIVNCKLPARSKFSIFTFCSGYFLAVLLLALFFFGTLSFITHEPGPMNLPLFFGEMGRNILLTSGLLVASLYAVSKDKDIKRMDKVILSSFSYGFIVTYYVNTGIYKVFSGQPMEWHMLKKKGNEAKAQISTS